MATVFRGACVAGPVSSPRSIICWSIRTGARFRLLRVQRGGQCGAGAPPLFIPVEIVERLIDDVVGVDRSRTQVSRAPVYDPALADRDKQLTALYGYYGYIPYGARGHVPPARVFFRW